MGTQITMSPYYGIPDFSPIASPASSPPVDLVSVADLLRNAFVYPPFSILQGVRLVTFGFCPRDDMDAAPEFRFKFRNAGEVPEVASSDQDWVGGYHRLLCESVQRSCAGMHAPWLLQSGGKDSTTLAIAIAEARPDTTCITYLGGREENEVDSAARVARTLGLRHETLVCDPGRAYDRYLAIVDRMPLLTADFALLSCVDLGTEVKGKGGDGLIDGLGADSYFGTADESPRNTSWRRLSRDISLSSRVAELPLLDRSFRLCYLLSTLQMNPIERVFPGSRFSDDEVDELFGRDIARQSRQRLELFLDEIGSATSACRMARHVDLDRRFRRRVRQGPVHRQRAVAAGGVPVLRPDVARVDPPRGSPLREGRSEDADEQTADPPAHRHPLRRPALRAEQGQLPLRPARTGTSTLRSRPATSPTARATCSRRRHVARAQPQAAGQQVPRVQVLSACDRPAVAGVETSRRH